MIGEGRTAEIIAWGDGKVLKLYKDWTDPSWAEREYASSVMAYEGGAPVPRPYELIQHDGRSGIVFERVEGRTALTLIRTQPWRLVEITRVMAKMQAVYLKAPGTGLPSNKGGLEWGIRRVIEGGLGEERGERILAALAALPDGDRLCHMDFHPDNVMLTKRGWVIIDWMNTRCGPPLSDVARTSLIFRVGEPPKVYSRCSGNQVVGANSDQELPHGDQRAAGLHGRRAGCLAAPGCHCALVGEHPWGAGKDPADDRPAA